MRSSRNTPTSLTSLKKSVSCKKNKILLHQTLLCRGSRQYYAPRRCCCCRSRLEVAKLPLGYRRVQAVLNGPRQAQIAAALNLTYPVIPEGDLSATREVVPVNGKYAFEAVVLAVGRGASAITSAARDSPRCDHTRAEAHSHDDCLVSAVTVALALPVVSRCHLLVASHYTLASALAAPFAGVLSSPGQPVCACSTRAVSQPPHEMGCGRPTRQRVHCRRCQTAEYLRSQPSQ